MSKFIIEKSAPLQGCIKAEGAKNSALPILAACILSAGRCKLNGVPLLSDIDVMCRLLNEIGAQITKDSQKKSLSVDCTDIYETELSYELIKKIRASFLLAGPLLARLKRVRLQMPGGCAIGVRPIDLHLKGFSLLGAHINKEHGIIELTTKGLKGAKIYLDFPSVGATENIMMAAVCAKGETVISNCAVEPEIIDLADFLNKCGCKISGAGSDTITITGISDLSPCIHTVIPDRIEAGTYMAAAAATHGTVTINNVRCDHLTAVIAKLKEINVEVIQEDSRITVQPKGKYKNVDIKTLPYPGFPTDLQPQFMSLFSTISGASFINETVFENRFMHVGELSRMGADIRVEGNSAIIQGVKRMTGTQVRATDLRAGAGLIIAGLCAEGTSEIGDIYHIDRGYYKICDKLRTLGANIKRIDD